MFAASLSIYVSYQFINAEIRQCRNESAKLRGLSGLVGEVGRKFARVTWVAWVYKILAWVKKMAWATWVGLSAWVAWVHEIVSLKRHY